jgi:hypothetical protein
MQMPAIYVVVQGRKEVTVGDATYIYDPSQYLAVSLALPAVGRVVKASPKKPYLCMTLSVDTRALAALIVEAGLPGAARRPRRQSDLRERVGVPPFSTDFSGWCGCSTNPGTSQCSHR